MTSIQGLPIHRSLVWCAAFVALWNLGAITKGDENQRSAKMHRAQAGEPNKDGWYDAKSTEGHFSVSLPIRFNDFTARWKDKSGMAKVGYCIGSLSGEGIKFSASEFEGRQEKDDDKELKATADKFRKDPGSTVSEPRYFGFGKGRGVEVSVRSKVSGVMVREIVFPDRVFMLIVEYPIDIAKDVEPTAKRFLDSFEMSKISEPEK